MIDNIRHHPNIAPSHLRHQYNQEGQDVFDFHARFLVPMSQVPAFLDKEAMDFRIKFMQEELSEFIDGVIEKDLRKAADALVDLVYVVLGTALMMGLPWKRLWFRVQKKNMAKERAANDGSNSKRGSPLDVIKPPGWQPPDHTPDLGLGPYSVFDASAVGREIADYLRSTGDVVTQPKHHVSVAEPPSFRTNVGGDHA